LSRITTAPSYSTSTSILTIRGISPLAGRDDKV
jgi:hypothetical protein